MRDTLGNEESLLDVPGAGEADMGSNSEELEDQPEIDDSDIINEEEIVVNYQHLDQDMKGDDIDLIGDINGLGRER